MATILSEDKKIENAFYDTYTKKEGSENPWAIFDGVRLFTTDRALTNGLFKSFYY